MKCRFVPEDFNLCKDELSQERMIQRAAHLANRLLEQWEAESAQVVCRLDDRKWACDEVPDFARATHKAVLWRIRPREKE